MKRLLIRAAALTGGLAATTASAHLSGPPKTTTVITQQGDPARVTIGTTYGLVVPSAADGGAWRLVCDEAMWLVDLAISRVTWLDDGEFLIADGTRLIASSEGGCSYAEVPFFYSLGAVDVVAHPTAPGTVFVTSASFSGSSGVYVSADYGATYSALPLPTSSVSYTSVRVAPSDVERLYVTAIDGTGQHGRLHRSDDAGVTFDVLPIDDDGLVSARVGAVDGANRDRVFLTGIDGAGNVVLRSDDGGVTTTTILRDDRFIQGVELTADGRVFVATPTRVLASTGDGPFAELPSPVDGGCLGQSGDRLLTCGTRDVDSWVIGTATLSAPGSPSFAPFLAFQDIGGIATCPAGTTVATECGRTWATTEPQLQGTSASDTDGALERNSVVEAESTAAGCGASGGNRAPYALLGLMAAVAAHRRRSRRLS